MESLRTIRVYGRLARFLGRRTFQAAVSSAAEAVRFLLVNFPQLETHMSQQHYRVSVGGYALEEGELHDPAGQQVIKIVPVLTGAGAVGRIIAGVALIALAAFVPLGAIGALKLAPLVVGVGASLVLGGVSQLLTPVPKIPTGKDSEQDPRKSYSFSGVQQTSRQGVPVPICYGQTLVGSVVISAGIDTVQVAV
ncbi:MAG: tail assembly protein [Candidatus Fonsibacter ubiquis]